LVGVVGELAFLVGGDRVAFHDPLDGAFAVDHVLVGLVGDALQADVGIVQDDGLVRFPGGAGEGHFVDVVAGGGTVGNLLQGIGFQGFVAEVQLVEAAAGLAEGMEIGGKGDAGQALLQVGGEAGTVDEAVQDAIDVVEDGVAVNGLVVIVLLELADGGGGDVVDAAMVVICLFFFGKQIFVVPSGQVEGIAWKALTACG